MRCELFVQTWVIRADQKGRRPVRVRDGSEGRCSLLLAMRDVVEAVLCSVKPETRARRITIYGMASRQAYNLENEKTPDVYVMYIFTNIYIHSHACVCVAKDITFGCPFLFGQLKYDMRPLLGIKIEGRHFFWKSPSEGRLVYVG